MRWLIGVDLRERSHGAMQMAAWLHAHPCGGPTELVFTHVIDERTWGPADVAIALRPSIQTALTRQLAELELPEEHVQTQIVTARSIERGLARVAGETHCDGIVIGRLAPRSGHALVRLGTVARRMLRALPLPVMVVPSDMQRSDVGDGAIVLGSELDDSSVRAGTFAHTLAKGLARSLVVIHSDPAYLIVPDYIGGGAVVIPRAPSHDLAEVRMWVREANIDDAQSRIVEGPVVESLLAVAEQESAPLLVVGSHQLGLVDRIFTSSVASDLARLAGRPVLVVPPAAPS